MTNTSDAIADSTVPAAAAIFKSNTFIADAMGYTALPAAYKTAVWDAIEATWALGHAPTVSSPADRVSDPVTHSYQGTWDADTNTPTLTSGVGTEDHYYSCNVAGTTNLDGNNTWGVNSIAAFKDGGWIEQSDIAYVTVTCTQAEAQEIYGTKVAHALWLEHTQEFPWRITSYSLEECQGLFDPAFLFFHGWDTASAPYLEFQGICDFDPYGTYTLLADDILSGYTHKTPKRTIGELLDRCRLNGSHKSVHVGAFDPQGTLTPAEYFSTANNRTAQTYKISRHGCHSAAPVMAAMARSVNLPTKEYHSIVEGTGHHSAEFLSINLPPKAADFFFIPSYDNAPIGAVLTHGDDIYHTGYDLMLGAQRLAPRGYYEDYIFGSQPATIELQVTRITIHRYLEYAIEYLKDYYVTNGWQAFLDTWITPYLPLPTYQSTLDRIERDIKARNGEIV